MTTSSRKWIGAVPSLHRLSHHGRDLPGSSSVCTRRFHFSSLFSSTSASLKGKPSSSWTSSTEESSTRRWVHSQHALDGVSTREMAALEDRIWNAVGTKVKDSYLDQDLKSLGWMHRRLAVSKDKTIQILLKMPTLLHPSLDQIKQNVQIAAEQEIERWVLETNRTSSDNPISSVNVEAIAAKPLPWMAKDENDLKDIESRLGPGLTGVSHFLAVYSCKGGVGKSTIAVNLAYELARRGGRVGLLDVDVYGPSLPVLVKPDDSAVRKSPLGSGMVYPIEHHGVKMLSLGFVSPSSGVPGSGEGGGAAVMRGPMAGKVVAQLLKGTDWGELDVLILDLPPGTGDVQLAICQDLTLSGAVGVTTPSKLAISDARKGIEMFSSLGVQTLALVENMAYFECEGGGIHYPFGKGFDSFVNEEKGHLDIKLENVCKFPISTLANDATEDGDPLTLSRPKGATEELSSFELLGDIVSRELYTLPHRTSENQDLIVFHGSEETFDLVSLQLSLDDDAERPLVIRIFSESGAMQLRFAPSELRSRDPKTGEVVGSSGKSSKDATQQKKGMASVHKVDSSTKKNFPQAVEKKGKYGYQVTWADGARIIYSMLAIVKAGGGKPKP